MDELELPCKKIIDSGLVPDIFFKFILFTAIIFLIKKHGSTR
ncbi:MAG: hypothetical protein ACI9GZ_004627 [Bacteroidia bacterium]